MKPDVSKLLALFLVSAVGAALLFGETAALTTDLPAGEKVTTAPLR